MDKKIIAIIILSLIILGCIGVYGYNKITQKSYVEGYNQGVNDATLFMNQQMINSLNDYGYVAFSYQQDEQVYQLKLGILPEG